MENKKENPLFTLVNALFTDKEYVNSITYETAKQSIFMVLRRVAINYPLQANIFNDGKVNPLDVMKFLSDFLYSGYTPKWIYTTGAKKADEKKFSKDSITQKDIKEFKEHYNIGTRDFDSMMKLFKNDTINEIISFKQLKENKL